MEPTDFDLAGSTPEDCCASTTIPQVRHALSEILREAAARLDAAARLSECLQNSAVYDVGFVESSEAPEAPDADVAIADAARNIRAALRIVDGLISDDS